MIDPVVFLLISWLAGVAGGITSSLLGASTDPTQQFDKRKFGGAVATGVVVGLIFGITNASVNPVFQDPKATLFEITYQIGLVYVGAVGTDHLRNRVGDLITNRSENPQANDKPKTILRAIIFPASQTIKVQPSGQQNVTLDGSSSTGDIMAYAWNQLHGTTVALAGANSAKATFIAPSLRATETIVFTLTVTDKNLQTDTAQASVLLVVQG